MSTFAGVLPPTCSRRAKGAQRMEFVWTSSPLGIFVSAISAVVGPQKASFPRRFGLHSLRVGTPIASTGPSIDAKGRGSITMNKFDRRIFFDGHRRRGRLDDCWAAFSAPARAARPASRSVC